MTVPAQEALEALDVLAGYRGGDWVLERAQTRARYVPANRGLLPAYANRPDEEVQLGLPQHDSRVKDVCVLWTKVDTPDQLRRALAFRPLPTMAIQEGGSSRRCLLWALNNCVGYYDAKDHAAKLAYAFGAVRGKRVSPDLVRIPAPGSRVGARSHATCTRLSTDSFDPEQIVGRLKTPPVNDYLKKAA